jgi:hypothetical protein
VKHFDTTDWTDYVRNVGDVTKREEMARHLSSGCAKCQKLVSFLSKVVTVAGADHTTVPDYLVRNAKALFALRQPEKATLAATIAKLVYDSFREPLPAGVRGQQRVTRQAMYEAGNYCVDLRMEHERGGAMITLVGQVADRTNPARGVGGAPVMIMSGNDVLARANCNQFGEFQLEYEPRQHIRLHVPVAEGDRWIEVRLHELSSDEPRRDSASDTDFGDLDRKKD